MILKGSQRGSGQDLAAHLLKTDENEHVSLHELRGFAADDLRGAFKEAEAVSRGTRCRQYLFSLSLNPPEDSRASVEAFVDAIDRAERQLGLQGQPRAVIFHEKDGRRHAHCVWSRIDTETMKARQLSFFKRRLSGLSRDLYLEHGWEMPRGLENARERNPTNFSLAEWEQAKRQGIDPRWLKQAIQGCWQRSDSLGSFERALQDRGFFLAKGDKRDFVVLDHTGAVWSLPRTLDLKTKDVRTRLGTGEGLSSVEATKNTIAAKMTPALRRHIAEARETFAAREERLRGFKKEMTRLHRKAREMLVDRQKQEWEAETRERAARLPKGLRGLWSRITGKYRDIRTRNEAEAHQTQTRHGQERQAMIDRQRDQRDILQAKFKELRTEQAERLLALREDIGRYIKFTRGQGTSRGQDLGSSLTLKLDR